VRIGALLSYLSRSPHNEPELFCAILRGNCNLSAISDYCYYNVALNESHHHRLIEEPLPPPETMRDGTTTTSTAGLNRTSVALTLLAIGMLCLLAILNT
jgi:hypothetical protein